MNLRRVIPQINIVNDELWPLFVLFTAAVLLQHFIFLLNISVNFWNINVVGLIHLGFISTPEDSAPTIWPYWVFFELLKVYIQLYYVLIEVWVGFWAIFVFRCNQFWNCTFLGCFGYIWELHHESWGQNRPLIWRHLQK